jgi:hypothetical protein
VYYDQNKDKCPKPLNSEPILHDGDSDEYNVSTLRDIDPPDTRSICIGFERVGHASGTSDYM